MWKQTLLAAMSSMLILGLSPVSAGADVRPAVPLNAAHSAPSAVTPVAQKNFGAGGGHIGGGHIGNMGGMRMAHPEYLRRARALCDVPRNVPDDILRQLRDNGGIVMINSSRSQGRVCSNGS